MENAGENNNEPFKMENAGENNNELLKMEMENAGENNNGLLKMENAGEINNELDSSDTQTKRRRKKSLVWEHFTVEDVGDNCTRACCKRCKQTFSYSNGTKVAGTSHLKRHIALGICPVLRRREKSQLHSGPALFVAEPTRSATDPLKKQYLGTPFSSNIPFDQNRVRQEIAEMIILHEYALHMVEHSAFVSFVQNLQPQFNMVDFNTVQSDCVDIYLREKQDLAKLLGQIPGRISLALDLWMSSQTVGYVFLMGYFIDSNWKFHRRILNVVMVPFPYRGDALNHAVGVCLGDWGLVNKLSTLTLDKGIWNESETGNLRGFLSIKNPLILNGQFLIEHCYAHFLSSMAQDGLEFIREIVNKVRESIKYVKTSLAHEEKFLELKYQLQVPSTKNLLLDDQTHWNTTYLMLLTAIELKEVFSCLDTADSDYKLAPSMDEWKQIETLCIYLKLLHDAANILLLEATYPTANNYFQEVWKIQIELTQAAASEDVFVANLVHPLKEKSDIYWKDCSLVLTLAVVMDPRYKMRLVEFCFGKIYGDDASTYIRIVEEGVHELFSYYVIQPLMLTANVEVGNEQNIKIEPTEGLSPKASVSSTDDKLLDFDEFVSQYSSNQQTKSELGQYLEETVLPRAQVQDFDVLRWWKLNELKYPILSRMARDILSIPVSTVGLDSVFKVEGNKLDHYRSSLQPETLEALICAKDWLQCADPSNSFLKMEF